MRLIIFTLFVLVYSFSIGQTPEFAPVGANTETTQTIDLTPFSKGLYVLKLTGNDFSETMKIIKQ